MTAEQRSYKVLPARPGTCAVCATDHNPNHAHNLQSVFYGVRFKLKWGRYPTWEDACAHLSAEQRDEWKAAMADVGYEWTEPVGEPIAEPYTVSKPF